MKVRAEGKCENEPPQIVEMTKFGYFVNRNKTPLVYSSDVLCLDVSRKKQPNYLRVEVSMILFYVLCNGRLKKNNFTKIFRCQYMPSEGLKL